MSEPIVPASKQPCRREDALAVVTRLRDAGHVAYFAGGCVRDELLGITPKDYDVATDAPPDHVREIFKNTQAVGAAFGVILVRINKSVVEVATFRSDDVYLDGRRPSKVHFTNAEEDAKRRDFTINGLFLDPMKNQVIDHVGGQADLKDRVLRAIGEPEARFREDHLRLLRAVRFAARFDLTIEPQTAQAIRSQAEQLKLISPERVAEELRLMLAPASRAAAWKLLNEFGLDQVIFRFAPAATSRQAILEDLGNDPAPLGLALAAAALERHEIPAGIQREQVQEFVRAMRQALRFSNDEADDLRDSLLGIDMILTDSPPRLATKKRFLARSTSNHSRRLMRALVAAGILPDRIGPLLIELEALLKTDYAPTPFVTGDDLTAAGMQPGKVFRQILDTVYDAQLEGRVRTKEEAMKLATAPSTGSPP